MPKKKVKRLDNIVMEGTKIKLKKDGDVEVEESGFYPVEKHLIGLKKSKKGKKARKTK